MTSSHHNYDVISPVPANWDPVDINNQIEEIIDPEADLMVVLARGATGFGFRIVGGTEEGSQVAVGNIVPGTLLIFNAIEGFILILI